MHSVVLLFLLSACSFFATSDKSPSAKASYQLPALSSPWRSQVTDKADYLFSAPQGASLMVQSFCHEFQAPTLLQLATQTFNSLDKAEVLKQQEFMLQERTALRTQARGWLDGVRVYLTLINSKRNNCYYDFLEILPHQQSDSVIEELIEGVRFK